MALPHTALAEGDSARSGLGWKRPEYKSQGVAVGLSVLSTTVPLFMASALSSETSNSEVLVGTLAIGGLVIGPSLGQFYASSPGTALLGVFLRFLGGGMAITGLSKSVAWCDSETGKDCGDDKGSELMIAGAMLYTGGVVYSLVDGYFSVNRWNIRQDGPDYGFSPSLVPEEDGALRTGAVAWMRF